MDLLTIVKSLFQTLFGLLFVIDCMLNGRRSMTIMFGSFCSDSLNFPVLIVITGLITITCVLSATFVSIFTSILILSELRNILVDICALLYPSFVEVWIAASSCLALVVFVPIGLGLTLTVCGLSKFAKSINVRIMSFSFTVCVIGCTWIGLFDGNGNQLLLISRAVQTYSSAIFSTIALIQICYSLAKFNSRFPSITLCFVLLISTLYPGLKRQFITKFSRFELVDSSLSTSFVAVVHDRQLDVKVMRVDHSIVGGVFNEGFESVFETFY
jgi:hypothetical protein